MQPAFLGVIGHSCSESHVLLYCDHGPWLIFLYFLLKKISMVPGRSNTNNIAKLIAVNLIEQCINVYMLSKLILLKIFLICFTGWEISITSALFVRCLSITFG